MQTMAIGLNHRTTRQHHTWAVRFALCIALVMALAPTLSHALAWSQGSDGRYMEICTVTGSRMVPADATLSSADSPTGHETVLSLSHCPFCLHATHSLALPPYVSLPAFAGLGEPVVPALGLATLHITQPVCVPPPRGPPASL